MKKCLKDELRKVRVKGYDICDTENSTGYVTEKYFYEKLISNLT